jgi:hypothetical protein
LVWLVHAGERTVDGALDTAGNGRCSRHNAASAQQLGHIEVVERGARAVDGSGTCRRKARLDGRHTSDGVCAAARSKQPQVHLDLSGLARFSSTARRSAHRVGERTRHAHLGVQVAVVGGSEDAEQRRRCWKQIGVASLGSLTNTSRAMWKTAAWLAQTIEHLVRVLLVKTRRSQLGDGQATGSNPAGIELGTNVGFRKRARW